MATQQKQKEIHTWKTKDPHLKYLLFFIYYTKMSKDADTDGLLYISNTISGNAAVE